MKNLMLCLVVLMIVLAACDNRSTDAPEMNILATPTVLYNENSSLNYSNIEIDLDGDKSSTIDRRINIEYDTTLGTFNPDISYSGSAYFIRTDSLGIARGTFSVKDSASGDVPVTFTMETYQSVHETIHFMVMDIPEIEITASQDSILADGTTLTDIYVQLTSETENIGEQWIDFESNLTLIDASVQTDSLGQATTQVQAPANPGSYYITAEIRDLNRQATIHLWYN